jgi:hypothetical protein
MSFFLALGLHMIHKSRGSHAAAAGMKTNTVHVKPAVLTGTSELQLSWLLTWF